MIPLSHVIAAANLHVNQIGISVHEEMRECDLDSNITLDSFRLTADVRDRLSVDFDTEFKAISGFFH